MSKAIALFSAAELMEGIKRANPGLSTDVARQMVKSTIKSALGGKVPSDAVSADLSTLATPEGPTTLEELASAIARSKKIPLAEAQCIALTLSLRE